MPEAVHILVAAITMFVGSTVVSTLGFGLGITTIPVLLLVLDPQTVVGLVVSVGSGSSRSSSPRVASPSRLQRWSQ